MRKLLLFILFLSAITSQGQILDSTISGDIDSLLHAAIVSTSDSGYMISYSRKTQPHVDHDIQLLKIDSVGNQMWLKTISTDSTDRVFELEKTLDGGFIILGASEFWYNPLVIRLNHLGDTLWVKDTFNFPSVNKNDFRISAQELYVMSDGHYLMAGYAQSNVNSQDRGHFIAKFDDNGNLIWDQVFMRNANFDEYKDISVDHDGNIILSGIYSSATGKEMYTFHRLSNQGQFLWETLLGDTNTAGSIDDIEIIQITDSSFFFFGQKAAVQFEKTIGVIDINGNILFSKTEGSGHWGDPQDLYLNKDSNIVGLAAGLDSVKVLVYSQFGDTLSQQTNFHAAYYNFHNSTVNHKGQLATISMLALKAGLQFQIFDGLKLNPPPSIDSIFPGDANSDGVANVYDIVPIGYAFSSGGPIRINASNLWTSQSGQVWGDTLPNGLDLMHADCNGDGSINAADTIAILQNYGLTHNKGGAINWGTTQSAVPVFLESTSSAVNPGDTVIINIKIGDIGNSATDVGATIATFDFVQGVVEDLEFEFVSSWFGQPNNTISVQKLDLNNGQLHIGLSRTDQNTSSGSGTIGVLKAAIKSNLSAADTIFSIEISDVSVIESAMLPVPIDVHSDLKDTIQINDPVVTNIISQINDQNIIYPTYFQDIISIENVKSIGQVSIIDPSGKLVLSETYNRQKVEMNLGHLNKGLYFVTFGSAPNRPKKIFKID
ncbi:MAG: T9SS type A sorting domain-containing protein [Flavobacteriales bacterium]|nr:T9SS type A sorting domain-containing protein [Flavobacteriales bacterium]